MYTKPLYVYSCFGLVLVSKGVTLEDGDYNDEKRTYSVRESAGM